MTHKVKARITTGIVMAALCSVVWWKQGGFQEFAPAQESATAEPQDVIYKALDAVREGSLANYLDAHTGSMRQSLVRAAAEIGEARLLQSLKERSAPLKGIAILEPERLSERDVRAKVEYVFADRNEVQTYYLEKSGDAWKIARVEGAQRVQTVIPYGTPAN